LALGSHLDEHNSNTYNDWFLDRVFILAPMQRVAGQFLITMKDYPPSQTPGSFNLDGIQKKIQATMGGR
jgi:arylsulfatase